MDALSGAAFGRLTVLTLLDKFAVCECSCGTIKRVRCMDLLSGDARSCGCLRNEITSRLHTTHGQSTSRVYQIWRTMLTRCRNPNTVQYIYYGAKGIQVCPDWLKFEGFFQDMGKPPTHEHILVRRDIRSGYYKDNCRWMHKLEFYHTRSERVK